jgi:hypothetical protein
METDEYIVRLDMTRLPKDLESNIQALSIAESLLNFCKAFEIWDEPSNKHRIFHTRIIPQDIPQVGIHWITVDNLPKHPYQ